MHKHITNDQDVIAAENSLVNDVNIGGLSLAKHFEIEYPAATRKIWFFTNKKNVYQGQNRCGSRNDESDKNENAKKEIKRFP